MSVYAIAQLKITDRAAYDRYQAKFMSVMKRFQGRVLAADEKPQVVEGKWERDKVVLLSFPDETAFREWSQSPEYKEISKDRKAGSEASAAGEGNWLIGSFHRRDAEEESLTNGLPTFRLDRVDFS